jgi:hypothetical protein
MSKGSKYAVGKDDLKRLEKQLKTKVKDALDDDLPRGVKRCIEDVLEEFVKTLDFVSTAPEPSKTRVSHAKPEASQPKVNKPKQSIASKIDLSKLTEIDDGGKSIDIKDPSDLRAELTRKIEKSTFTEQVMTKGSLSDKDMDDYLLSKMGVKSNNSTDDDVDDELKNNPLYQLTLLNSKGGYDGSKNEERANQRDSIIRRMNEQRAKDAAMANIATKKMLEKLQYEDNSNKDN